MFCKTLNQNLFLNFQLSIMKPLICILLFLGLAWSVQSQTPYPAPYHPKFSSAADNPCYSPGLQAFQVIYYAQGPMVFAQFSDAVSQVRLKRADQPTFSTIAIGGEEKLLPGLVANKDYEVYVLDQCGQYVLGGSFSTAITTAQGIAVSEKMYRALRDFQQQPSVSSVPLGQFLENRQDVAFFEKVYFIQQYFLKGAVIPTFSDQKLPEFRPPTICNCEYVWNILQYVVPGEDLMNGLIKTRSEHQEKQGLGSDYSAFWWWRDTKGAAKWHHLWTEGSKAGGADLGYEMKMGDSSVTFGTQYGQLRYNLLCSNFNQLPEDCKCSTPLRLYWDYDTEVCAFAETHSEGFGNRSAVAAAEDIAIAVLEYDGTNKPYVIEGAVVRTSAECNRTVNSEFWAQAARVALNAAAVVYGLSAGETLTTAQQAIFDEGVKEITDNVDKLIKTPYYSNNGCPDLPGCQRVNVIKGDTLIYLPPNQPINLTLLSNTSLMAGGKRSWFSWSKIRSNFHLTGYIPGGYGIGDGADCCSKKRANWVLASCEGPLSTEEVKVQVGGELGAYSPWPDMPASSFTGVVQILYEVWKTAVNMANCPEGGNFTGGGNDRNTPERDLSATEVPTDYRCRIFDVSGKLLYQGKPDALPVDFKAYLREKMPQVAAGIYFVQAVSTTEKKIFKIFLD